MRRNKAARRRLGSRFGVVAATCALLSQPVAAQERPRLESGQRLRISVDCTSPSIGSASRARPRCPEGGSVTGTLVRLAADTLVLESGESVATYPLAAVTSLEASRGTRSHWRTGALLGFAAGTTVTFLVLNSGSPASTNACDPGSNQDAIGGTGTCLLFAMGLGGLPGGLVGLIVGSLLRTEDWERVRLDGLALSVFPSGRGPTLAVSLPLG